MDSSIEALEGIFSDYLILKKLPRTGWKLRGISTPESIADHCFGVTFLTMLISDWVKRFHKEREFDPLKALKMALIHEIGECRIGDIPFPALKYFPSKSEGEKSAVKDIFSQLPDMGSHYIELFCEFEDSNTTEAKFVKAIDKLEMLITAAEYERIGFRSVSDFWENAKTFETFKEFPEIDLIAQRLLYNHNQSCKSL
ncbi:HD family hydrolase [bacterium]|nr:HD family hydrolase [bacterium]